MNKVLIDSNIIIGSIKGRFSFSKLETNQSFASEITRLEVLGYHKIKSFEEEYILKFLQNIDITPISKEIIDRAIQIRKTKSMSIGDAIIAATALVKGLPLLTANSKDFQHLEELELIELAKIKK